jgi:hypothetical protein
MPLPTDFTPLNGASGVSIACNTSSSTRGTLPSVESVANAMVVTNTGVNYAFFAMGDSTVSATTAALAISPGDQIILTIPYAGTSRSPTHVAAISTNDVTTLQVTLGMI